MAASARVPLTADEVDDLIYSARVGDLDALRDDITALSGTHGCAAADVIVAAVDRQPQSEGGTGACLLHYPAANGHTEVIAYLLDSLPPTHLSKIIDLRNYAGNTPLHWAALNTQLDCVKALVRAGADVHVKNQDGHDAAFLAERTEWDAATATATPGDGAAEESGENNDENGKGKDAAGAGDEEVEIEVGTGAEDDGEGANKPLPPLSKAMQVVHHLLETDDQRPAPTAGEAQTTAANAQPAASSSSASDSASLAAKVGAIDLSEEKESAP
ncbi:hypothetical protein KEM52_006549 [Ascosphaera acerosa]|nr:hypothetical protein KEM52_006549 [Ascosphaera acerosa]